MNIMQQFQQLGNIVRGIKNPQQAVLQLLENNTNPMAKKVLEMAKKGDKQGIEQFARNVCKEKGVNYEEQMSNFRNNIGL